MKCPAGNKRQKREGRNFEMSCCSCEHIVQYRQTITYVMLVPILIE